MDRVLSQHVTLFTPAMIQELIKEIDQDDNDTLEFMEILTVKDQAVKHYNTCRCTTYPITYDCIV